MNIPDNLKYSQEHEWVRQDEHQLVIGITDYAQDSLGDIVFVSLPSVGDTFDRDAVVGEVESTKSVSDIYTPISGKVIRVNEALVDQPELVNSDPYGQGWICAIDPTAPDEFAGLMDHTAYRAFTENQQ